MNPISYGANICRNLNTALKKEWEERNSLGAYAASTIVGINTKPSHGLLAIASKSKSAHTVLLSSLEETLFIGDRPFPLSAHLYADMVYPKGFEHLEHFYKLPFPTWVFRVENLTVVKMVILIQGENTVLIRYQMLSSYGDFVRLQIRPIMALRSANALSKENPKVVPTLQPSRGVIRLDMPDSGGPLFLFHNAGVIDKAGLWFKRLHYPKSPSLPLGAEEDLYSPCSFLCAFLREDGVFLSVSTSQERRFDPFVIGLKEKRRHEA
jgi:predicted glycogen debranching enzyme